MHSKQRISSEIQRVQLVSLILFTLIMKVKNKVTLKMNGVQSEKIQKYGQLYDNVRLLIN